MSSVTPSDNSYQYYQKRVSDLEDEYSEERKKSNAKNEERLANADDNYKRLLKERDQKTEEIVENYRNRSAESARQSHENHRADLEKLNADRYDRNGRLAGAEAEQVRNQLKSAMETNQSLQDRQSARERDVDAAYKARLEDGGRDYQERIETAVRRTKEETAAGYERSAEDSKSAAIAENEEGKKKYELLNTERITALNEARRTNQKQIEDVRTDYENQKKALTASTEARLDKQARMTGKDDELKVRRINDAHNEQTHGLHDQIRELISHEGTYARDKANGRADAIREYDNEWRQKADMANEAYEKQLGNQRLQARDSSDHASRVNREVLREKEMGFAERAAQQTLEHHQEKQMFQEQTQVALNAQQRQMAQQRDSAETHLANRMAEATEERAQALAHQSQTYQDTIASQNAGKRAEMERLQAELNYHRTSDDVSSISPAAEAAVRRSAAKQYGKTMDAEMERNRRSEASIQRSYSDRLSDTVAESETRHTALNRRQEGEHHMEKRALTDYISEINSTKDATVHQASEDQNRQAELLGRNFARASAAQREDYENILANQRSASSDQINTLRHEFSFKERNLQRDHANAQNELIHGYEKKLYDQKTDYETQMDAVRAQGQQALHESENRSKRLIEDQMRGYEQRIAQTEAAYKERERALTENYREQIERVRRNHELQQSKKG